jgi:hypothetical protein
MTLIVIACVTSFCLLMMMANMMACTMDMFGMLMQIEVFGSSSSSSFGADDECGSFADFSRRV